MAHQLHMIWPEGKTPAAVPAINPEYAVRPLRNEDQAGQVRVMNDAGFAAWDETQLAAWRRGPALPDGVFVAIHLQSGQVAATASASHCPSAIHPSGGEIGWVAASPAHAGRGLGTAVSAAALHRQLDAGYRRIYLRTDDFRQAALRLYLRLGFVPFLFSDDMESRWRAVCEALAQPLDPEAWVRAPADQWLATPAPRRPDSDRKERYAPRHVWLPAREHRGYSCNGDMDAFGDESLYRPSRLGSACAAPAEVEAGSTAPLTLTFCAGPAGVPKGAAVTFVMRGQRPLGPLPGAHIEGPESAVLEARDCGFAILEGALKEGDRVTLQWPPFDWTPLAGRREFKVVISYGEGRPEQRHPKPVVVHVLPRGLERIETTAPCTRRTGDPIDIRVTARDRYDNRAPITGDVLIMGPWGETTARLTAGIATARIDGPDTPVVRATARLDPDGPACVSNPTVTSARRQVYVGDLHCHDFLSEAEGYPDDVYQWARDDRRLDFVSVAPQSHGWHDNQTWTLVKYMNERYLDEGRFVTFPGFEWQHSGYGDKVIHYLGGDQPYLPRDDPRYSSPAGLYEALRASDALVISHHPCYPAGSWCSSTDFDAVETDVERLVEIWSMHGSSEGFDPADRPLAGSDPERTALAALRKGLRLGFTAGSDTHSGRPGGSAKEPLPHWGGLTAVWAEQLTRRAVFQALHERRTYALTRARIVMTFVANDLPMGSEGPASPTACLRLDAWAPGPIAGVDLCKNGRLLRHVATRGDECHIEWDDRTGGTAFYHARVRMADGNLAVCSPVWLG